MTETVGAVVDGDDAPPQADTKMASIAAGSVDDLMA